MQPMPKRSREDSPPISISSPQTPSSDSSSVSFHESSHASKYVQIPGEQKTKVVMKCSLPPHNGVISFSTFDDFEVHYAKEHTHRCSQCKKNFPTEYYLGLHIGENHDPINEIRKAKGDKIYRCFVEGCEKVCSAPLRRRLHLIDKHSFPKNYDIFIVNTGIDNRSSMLRKGQNRIRSIASRSVDRNQAIEGADQGSRPSDRSETPDDTARHANATSFEGDVDELASTMSSLKFVPPSIRFGRAGRRGGLSRS